MRIPRPSINLQEWFANDTTVIDMTSSPQSNQMERIKKKKNFANFQ